MDEVIAPTSVATGADAAVPAVNAPPAAVGDPALLLHVDVDELARSVALVANDRPGRAVEVTQPWRTVAAKDSVHRGGCLSERPGDPVWSLKGL